MSEKLPQSPPLEVIERGPIPWTVIIRVVASGIVLEALVVTLVLLLS